MNVKKYIIGLILIALFGVNLTAQQPFSQQYNVSNGLPSNAIYSLLEDRDGFIWFTSEEGLFRYDGNQFKSYRTIEQSSYAGSSLIQDSLGRVWYQDFDGNSFYVQNGALRSLPQKSTSSFYPLRFTKEHAFFQEHKDLCVADLNSLKVLKRFPHQKEVYAAAVIGEDYFYVEDYSIYSIDKKLKRTKRGELPMEFMEFPILFSDGESLYFTKKSGKQNGIWHVKNGQSELLIPLDADLIVQNAKVIGEKIFVLTTNGTLWFNRKNAAKPKGFFSTENASDILMDRKGNYWISSNINGLFVLSNIDVQKRTFDDFSPFRIIVHEKRLLLSSKHEQVKWFDPRSGSLETFATGQNNSLPYYLFVDVLRQQLVYVQSDGYTYFSDLNAKRLLHKKVQAIKKIVQFDTKYNAFVSAGFVGFYCHKSDLPKASKFDEYIQKLEHTVDGDFHFFRLNIEGRAKSVFFNAENKQLYFISNLGVFRWEKGRIIEHKFDHFVPGVLNIRVWNHQEFALSIAGDIIELKTGKLSSNNRELGKISGIKQVITYNDDLFIRTSDKIWVMRASKNGKAEVYTSFGLSNVECMDFAVLERTVWMLTTEGIVSWNFSKKQKATTPGLFKVLSTSVNGAKIAGLSGAKLSYTENNISIDFALLDFGLPTISELQYRMNNQSWEATDPRIRSLNFPALSPGNYSIQTRGMVDGEWVYFQAFDFQISPPFWSTTWFYLSLLLLITALLIVYYNGKLKANKEKNRLINEKIVLESNLNKSLLASIKSQMNPHFIFNALNTIQAYIYVNDKENATNYLSKFSKLTRSVLEMSEKDKIYLSEEIATLKLYLELEKMRFQEGFEYEFILINVRPDQVKIPAMIVQPYIENAIKHGLLHSPHSKRLKISFGLEKSVLIVVIDDNGIGRKKAEELRLKREGMHAGFATKANEKRIDLLNERREISVHYQDNYAADGQATGTTVTLKIYLDE